MKMNRLAAALSCTAVLLAASFAANATHSWANYHWARTSQDFPLQVIDSNTPDWDGELAQTLTDWSKSTAFNLPVTGYDDSSRTRKLCRAVSGKIRSCNASYGNNGWLGLASINISGDHVMCQEIGHLLGLGHTSENGTSQNTCMDYSASTTSTRPNQHDCDVLASKPAHLDSINTYSTSLAATPLSPGQQSMAGLVPMGTRVHKGVFNEIWAAPDGKGGTWIHHVTLAAGHENLDVLN